MKKIKVLHLITRLDPGGSSYNTIENVARLDKSRYQTLLVSGQTFDPHRHVSDLLNEKSVRVLYIKNLIRPISIFNDLRAICRIYHIIKRFKCDVIHTHTSKAGILGRWAAFFAGVKHIVHTPHGHVFYGYFGKLKSQFFIISERLTALLTHKIITLTKMGKQEHVNFKIAKPEKFVPIYSGIDINFFRDMPYDRLAKCKELEIDPKAFIFGTAARLDPIKGNKFTVRAMTKVINELPNAHLLLVGDGTEKQNLQDLAAELGVGNHITFAGYRNDIAELIHIMDVFILASANEGMGRVLLEAMACSKPVIASRTGGIPELVEDQETGILVKPKDSQALAQAMMSLHNDHDNREKMKANALKRLEESFSIEVMVKQIDQVYQSLIQSK